MNGRTARQTPAAMTSRREGRSSERVITRSAAKEQARYGNSVTISVAWSRLYGLVATANPAAMAPQPGPSRAASRMVRKIAARAEASTISFAPMTEYGAIKDNGTRSIGSPGGRRVWTGSPGRSISR